MRIIERGRGTVYILWINWAGQIISFQKAEGFVEIRFDTQREMLEFAAEKGNAGFRIQ